MTYQQTPNAYPLVYEMRIVDDQYFTDIETIDKNLVCANSTVAVVDDHHLYAITISDNVGPAQITKLTRQNFHEHYFVAGSLEGSSEYPNLTGCPQAKIRYLNDHLYVMSIGNTIMMERFSIVDYDISLDWGVSITPNDYDYAQYDNDNLYGFESDTYTWVYYYNNGGVSMHRIDDLGALDTSLNFSLVPDITSISINYTNDVNPDAVVTYMTDGLIYISYISSGQLQDQVQVQVQPNNAGPAAGYPVARCDTTNAFISYIDRDTGHLSFASSILPDQVSSTSMTLPNRYTINRTDRFNEIHDPDQTNYGLVMTSNPLNDNFFYLAYFTSDGQIRVIKFYRHQQTDQAQVQYLIMWATKDGCFIDAGTPGSGRRLNIVTDHCGDLYVFCRHNEGTLRMWKIREYILDFGHDILSPLASDVPASVFPDFLRAITDNYTMADLDSPALNDVIVLDVGRVSGNYHVTFKYINYDVFQSPEPDETGLTISQQFNAELLEVLTTLYGSHNNVSIINFDGVFRIYDSFEPHTVTVILPTSHLVKPCVVRGTHIVVWHDGRADQIPIERIRKGDLVVNQDGLPVRVTHHTVDTITTDSWTTPYIIPVGYFGSGPYMPLLISGDHGIRMTRKDGTVARLYPYSIKRGLKRVAVGTIVEYHHLVLDNDQDFYIANGVLIESERKMVLK